MLTEVFLGINSSNVPAYQSELARPKHRGALLCAQGTITIFGLCIAYWLDYGLAFTDSPAQWRFPIAFQGFFAIALVLQMLPLPESPRWLLEHGKTTRASSILARLQYEPATVDSEEVVMMRRQIESALELEHAGGPFSYKELFTMGRVQNLRRMVSTSLLGLTSLSLIFDEVAVCCHKYPTTIHVSLSMYGNFPS